jgi:hypothetical protein
VWLKTLPWIAAMQPVEEAKGGPMQVAIGGCMNLSSRKISECLRKSLLPVEGPVPNLSGIEMYGSSRKFSSSTYSPAATRYRCSDSTRSEIVKGIS